MRKYYEAYDERYKQVHGENLRWASDCPSPIVEQTIKKWGVRQEQKSLELGCGEGRDAGFLLGRGYDLLATDISPEAIRCCKEDHSGHEAAFQVLDCVAGKLDQRFDFIYAVAVVHMLVEDADRDGFYSFIREHLTENGVALICTMGDGTMERSLDISTAFELQQRTHQQSGKTLHIAGTSCRMVSFEIFRQELARNGLRIEEEGLTAVEPDFPVMMYAVVKRK